MDRKIRICHIVNHLGPAGKEKGLLKLIDHMDRTRFESTIIVLNEIWTMGGEFQVDQYDIIHIEKSAGNQLRLPFQLRKIFMKRHFDIVHTRSWGTLVEGGLAAKMARVPVVVHGEHGTFPLQYPHTLIQSIFWRWADAAYSVSAVLRDNLVAATGVSKDTFRVILNGVEADRYYPDETLRRTARRELGFGDDDFIVGMVARLVDVKNHPMLIRAIAVLRNRGENVQAVLLGSPPTPEKEAALRKLADSLGISDAVHFIGFRNDVNRIINSFDVLTLTSFSEGCSNVLQEAMFAQQAVIATAVGGNSEIVLDGQSGLLVESDNHAQLAEKILYLKDNPDVRRRLACEGRRQAKEKFSLQSMVRSYEKLYMDALSSVKAWPVDVLQKI